MTQALSHAIARPPGATSANREDQHAFVSVGPHSLVVMAFDDIVSRWKTRINNAAVVINGLSQTLETSGPVPLGRTFLGGLRDSVLGDIVDSAKSDWLGPR